VKGIGRGEEVEIRIQRGRQSHCKSGFQKKRSEASASWPGRGKEKENYEWETCALGNRTRTKGGLTIEKNEGMKGD